MFVDYFQIHLDEIINILYPLDPGQDCAPVDSFDDRVQELCERLEEKLFAMEQILQEMESASQRSIALEQLEALPAGRFGTPARGPVGSPAPPPRTEPQTPVGCKSSPRGRGDGDPKLPSVTCSQLAAWTRTISGCYCQQLKVNKCVLEQVARLENRYLIYM